MESEIVESRTDPMSAPISTIAEIGKHEGQSVTIRGWLYNLHESGKLLFPIFRDGSGQIQGVVPKNAVSPETFDALKGLTQESSVIVEGRVRHEFGPGLKQVLENEAGDFIYIKPGVPHEVFNMSDTEPVVAFVARSSANEWDEIIPYDRNEGR